ncbi:hypothetical protein ACFQX6_09390 [Streptosporangium lutulentum]
MIIVRRACAGANGTDPPVRGEQVPPAELRDLLTAVTVGRFLDLHAPP